MAINNNGLTIERFNDILNDTSEDLNKVLGGKLDFSSNSLIGVLSNIYCLSESYIWELLQGLYDSISLGSAEGIYLENLALLVGDVRLQPTKTRGVTWFTGEEGTLVGSDTKLKSIKNDIFLVEEPFVITSVESLQVKMLVSELTPNTNYVVSVNGANSEFITSSNPDTLTILNKLRDLIVASGVVNDKTTVVFEDKLHPEYSYLTIDKYDKKVTMSVSASTNLMFTDVITPAFIIANEFGAIPAKVSTINELVTPVSGVSYVNNPEDLKMGRGVETDEEFRVRIESSYFRVAGGTPDSMYNAIMRLDGVTSVKVKENRTFTKDSEGMPPKSCKVIVQHGSNEEIIETIWKNKASGTSVWSDIHNPLTVKGYYSDFNQQTHLVRFTRPTTKYCWVKVEYSKYIDDGLENFPVDGEEIMRQSIAAYGKTFVLGQDLIPKRFYKEIYNNVDGINDVSIKFALTDTVDIPPKPADYTSDRLSVSDEEATDFSPSPIRISVVYNPNL